MYPQRAAVFFFLVAVINVILKLIGPRAAFARGELILIYVMMMTSCAVTGMGLTHYQIPLMATFSYFTTPENAWATLIAPHVSGWMVVEDPLASKYFFEGLPEDAYGWYLDLRKYGTFVHSGFGLGVERMVAWICGTPHVR